MENKKIRRHIAPILPRRIQPEHNRRMDKELHASFLHERWPRNCRSITLISTTAKIYNALLLNCIESEIENILWKNQNGFWRNRSTGSQILTISWNLAGVRAKNLEVNLSKAFDSVHGGKIAQILQVRSLDGDIKVCHCARCSARQNITPYQFIIYLDYVRWTSIDLTKENGFTLEKPGNRRYHAQTITDADYADHTALQANTPSQAESLLHSLERAADGIELYMNADKTGCMCLSQSDHILTLNGGFLKLVDTFTTSKATSYLRKRTSILDQRRRE